MQVVALATSSSPRLLSEKHEVGESHVTAEGDRHPVLRVACEPSLLQVFVDHLEDPSVTVPHAGGG